MQRLIPGRTEPVEDSNCVRTRIGAIAGPDTAVVHLRVQPFRRVVARISGTHGLAGSRAALLTENRPEPGANVWIFTLPIPFNVNPVHSPPFFRLFWAHGGNVVLRVAGDDTRLATGATVEINYHTPLMRH